MINSKSFVQTLGDDDEVPAAPDGGADAHGGKALGTECLRPRRRPALTSVQLLPQQSCAPAFAGVTANSSYKFYPPQPCV